MRTTLWLLDINYTGELKPQVWLWGIDEHGQRVLVIDQNFQHYFYLVVKNGQNPDEIIEKIRSQKARFPGILGLISLRRKLFGRPVDVIKVVCQAPEFITKHGKTMAKIEGVEKVLEDDIRYSMRYLIDNGLSPCSWHQMEVEPTRNTMNVQVDRLYMARSFPKPIDKGRPPQLRILALSTIAYSSRGAPQPETDPIVVISLVTNTGDEQQFVAKAFEDKPLIEAFISYVKSFDPDIIVGYGTNSQDWPYLIARAKKLGINLTVDRANGEPHRSVYGHISITGRANLDFLDFADEFPEVKVKTLENIADFLGVMNLEKRILIDDVDFAAYWENIEKRPILLQFSKENAQCIIGIADATLDFAMQLSSLVGLPLDHVGTASVGFRVEWFLMREAYRIGELIPKRIERPYFPYSGAIVLPPKPGVHENIAVLDFKAMYPNLMMTKNISPDTYVSPSESGPPSGVNVAPEVRHRFRREPDGFYKKVLTNLIAVRDKIRLQLSRTNQRHSEYKVLNARQKAVKTITNAAYGYTGWIGARWYIKTVAEATSAWGRSAIRNAVKLAKKIGLEIVYSDTDSVFVNNDPDKIKKLSEKISTELGLDIEPGKIYVRALFTEAKKKYCGLLPDGRLDIIGLEVVRGDWAACARKAQERVLEIILKNRSPKEASNYVLGYIKDLRGRKVPYKDLIIWKSLSKTVDKYAVKAPHVEAARLLIKEGWRLFKGDKIGYVITSGPGKLYERAKPYFLASYDSVDTEYYVENQVLPAVLRILTLFNISEEELLSDMDERRKEGQAKSDEK